jgi:hypothetical protein
MVAIMPSLPSKLLDDATNADFANLEIDIAVICSRIMAMFIFRLKQSTFAASSRSLLVGKGMLAAFADGHDAVAGGGLGELLPEGCTLAGAEVVVWREGAPDCSCEACSLCWRNSKGKREEQLLNWSANTRRMALGDGESTLDTSTKAIDGVGGPQKGTKSSDGWMHLAQAKQSNYIERWVSGDECPW